jgi:hypothetical protein
MPYTEGFERWWDVCWAAASSRGDEVVTVCPEHGPPNYQPCDVEQEPLSDIWDVNHWLALRQQRRFGELYGESNTSSLVEEA